MHEKGLVEIYVVINLRFRSPHQKQRANFCGKSSELSTPDSRAS